MFVVRARLRADVRLALYVVHPRPIWLLEHQVEYRAGEQLVAVVRLALFEAPRVVAVILRRRGPTARSLLAELLPEEPLAEKPDGVFLAPVEVREEERLVLHHRAADAEAHLALSANAPTWCRPDSDCLA